MIERIYNVVLLGGLLSGLGIIILGVISTMKD